MLGNGKTALHIMKIQEKKPNKPKNKEQNLSKLQDLCEFKAHLKIRGKKLKIMCFQKALLLS